MSDTLYDLYMPPAFVGMKVDTMNDNVESRPAGGNIPFGRVCNYNNTGAGGALGSQQVVSGVAGPPGPAAGIALHDHIIGSFGGLVGVPSVTVPPAGYRQFDAVSVLTRGRVWAEVSALAASANIIFGAPVDYEIATGMVTTGAPAGTAVLANATFRSAPIDIIPIWPSASLGAARIALVELHYPFAA
jgi:hypothetical protein